MRTEYDFTKGTRGKHTGRRINIVGDPSLRVARTPNTRSARGVANVTNQILRTKRVSVSWLYEGTEGFQYYSVPGTIMANPQAKSLRFELREENGDDENFEAVIKPKNGSYILRTDHPEIENHEFPLKVYLASDELVLYLEDASNRAYFHLS